MFLRDPLPSCPLFRLESEGSYEVAAGWAFFHGELDLAIEVLSRGGEERMRRR